VGEDYDRIVRIKNGWRPASRRWVEQFSRVDASLSLAVRMVDASTATLSSWESLYVIVGSSDATLFDRARFGSTQGRSAGSAWSTRAIWTDIVIMTWSG
jgi:hypothetical protein